MPRKPTEPTPMSREEIEEMIVIAVKKELANLAASFDARAMERHKGTGSRVVKKTVSVPSDLWNQLRRECPGAASQHVTQAITLYLTVRQSEQE